MIIQQLLQKYLFSVCLLFCAIVASEGFAQIPATQWSHCYGGSSVDIPHKIKFTSDGGTVTAGYTDSKNGDVSPHANREYWDLWILKLNSCGEVQWEKSFGGSAYESARDIEQTADGGFIVLGETNSTDGEVPSGYGGTKDIWLLKLDASGNLQWQKRYGGNGLDIGNHICINTDGSYLIAATSSSNNGDITGNHGTGGYTDAVIMKISATGSVVWSKCYGGTKNEELLDLEIINGKIFAAGYANSTDGDIPPSQKNYDAWLLALDQNGNKIFSKVYGGAQNDVAYSMTKGADGSLTLAGYTTSNDGDVSGAKGGQDYWVFNISQAGKLNWQKVLGGSAADYANVVITDKDSSYLIGGISYSNDGDITNPYGDGDYWVVKLSTTGNVIWKNNWGGRGNDHLRFLLNKPLLNEYYLAGDSDSYDGDFSSANGRGDADFGIIKLKEPVVEQKDSTVCSISDFIPVTDTLFDVCGYDSVLVTYSPVLITSPFHLLKQRDTIFTGESYTLPSINNGFITWNADAALSCSNCSNPVATPVTTTVYTAMNTSPLGCSVSDRFTLVVLNDAVVFTPNAFTPNNDGLNDWFGPLGKVPESFSMQIFNQYGETVFKSTNMNNRWDGTFRGKRQPPGTFIFFIQYKDMLKKPKQQKGTLLLIR
ncbi:MAG: gliding motility-associated C-terminal domain-containing protein [Lacibacter sp.]